MWFVQGKELLQMGKKKIQCCQLLIAKIDSLLIKINRWNWMISSWTYFKCHNGKSCCGNAWNRHCCYKKSRSWNPDTLATSLTFSLIIALFLALWCGCFISKKRQTVHYVKFSNWWENNMRRQKVNYQIVRIPISYLFYVNQTLKCKKNCNLFNLKAFSDNRKVTNHSTDELPISQECCS